MSLLLVSLALATLPHDRPGAKQARARVSAAERRAVARYVAAVRAPERAGEGRPGFLHQVQDTRPFLKGGSPKESALDLGQVSRLLADCRAAAPEKYAGGVWLVVRWNCRSGDLRGEQVFAQVRIESGEVAQAGFTIGPVIVRSSPAR